MGFFRFVWQYVTHFRSVGAIAPSSRFLARKMVTPINFETANCIVEFGAGTGVFTDAILKRMQKKTTLIAIERNADFCEILRKKFANIQNVHIIQGSAEKIGEYLAERNFSHADYIVSGLPFASLPAEVSEKILTNAQHFLRKEGRFITFQYTLFRREFIGRFFNSIEISREIRNLPPAYVFTCHNNV